MNDSVPNQVAPLTRATFTLKTAPPEGEAKTGPETLPQSLIVGLLPSGMTPFENLLLGKSPNTPITVTLSRSELADFFGPLPISPPPATGNSDPLTLAVTLLDIGRPDAREMVRAMAAQVEGCGGNCGCGCGGH
jgi:hypothetical protein